MNRQVHIQGKGPSGIRTSVSVHATLFELASKRLGGVDQTKALIRQWVLVGNDSWSVSDMLIRRALSQMPTNWDIEDFTK